MVPFVILTLVPSSLFLLYVLYQFWREATAQGNAGRDRSKLIATFGLPATQAQPKSRAVRKPDHRDAVIFMPAAEPPFDSRMLAVDLKSRLAVFPSGTERLALKRSAKGPL